MARNTLRLVWFLGAVSALGILTSVSPLSAQQEERTSGSAQLYSARPTLRWDRPQYRNYAYQNFSNYPDHAFPFTDSKRTYHGPMGDYLVTGYDLYKWEERRTPGQEYGSSIFKPNIGESSPSPSLPWEKVYDAMVLFRDGYGDWGYSFIVGDNLISRLSPLTMSMVDLAGFRVDLSTPYLKATAVASRIERPHYFQEVPNVWAIGFTHFADDSTLLLGGRLQADVDLGTLGFNLGNSHVYQSTQPGNSLKGRLRPHQPLMDWVIVRFSDDSPRDGIAGAHVQEAKLILNGESRPDILPVAISHPTGITPQVGTVNSITGEFRALNYHNLQGFGLFYRGRDSLPLWSDYLLRRDHEIGEDVSKIGNIEGLVRNFRMESPAEALAADGDRQLVFLYDLSQEPVVESVEIEVLLGNDYRVDVATLFEADPRAKSYHGQYKSTFYETVVRARDNVQDMTNLKRVRFHVGEDTGVFAYSADLNLTLRGLEVNAEYARSALYSRYPAHTEGRVPDFRSGPRFSQKDDAAYANATHWFKAGRVGAELFSINPEFTTSFRTYLREAPGAHFLGMMNNTIYWDMVQDNDDGDRFKDRRYGSIVGFANDFRSFDLDGVLLGQDEDNDGFPDVNRDGDNVPDYEEPFLMYDVEPNIYVYGLDRNNNDEPDLREDDGEVDYPYDLDERGYHLFAQYDLTPRLSFAAGHFAVNEIAGSGRNRTTYALLTLDVRDLMGRPRFFLENNFRRVQDDIFDEYKVVDDTPITNLVFGFRGLMDPSVLQRSDRGIHLNNPPIFTSVFRPDLLRYQDSYVNETYLDLNLNPWSTLNLRQKLRARFNWQQGGWLYNDTFQVGRRLDFWTWVSRLDYTKRWGKLSLTPQYKFMLLRLTDQERDVDLLSEHRSMPILRVEYRLLPRTTVRLGLQGFGPLPYRVEKTTARQSFEQRTTFLTLTNHSRYFGYELVTIMGVTKDHKDFDSKFQDQRNVDGMSWFLRAFVGFTEYGRPL